MFGTRRPWPYLAGAVVVLAIAILVLTRLGEPDIVPVAPADTGGVTIAGELTMAQTGAAASAHVTISADRAVTLRGLAVRVRDQAGAFHDFPELANVDVATTPRDLALNREPLPPGSYTYYLSYRRGADWVDLPPWHSITIR